MGKNPCSIFRELYSESKRKQDKIASIPDVVKSRIHQMSDEDHCCYVFYTDVIKKFLKEGYPERKALKHIQEWADNDLLMERYAEGYHLIGISEDVI